MGLAPSQVAPLPWTYRVDAVRDGELEIVATFPHSPGPLSVKEAARPFMTDVAALTGRGFVALPSRRGIWQLPPCPSAGCQLRYRFLLKKAATVVADDDVAQRRGPLLVTNPAAWLLRPRDAAAGQEVIISIGALLQPQFAAGWFAAAAANTYRISAEDLYHLPFALIGPLRRRTIALAGGATIDVVLPPPPLPDAPVMHWVEAAVTAVTGYFGRLPVPRALIYLPLGGGGGGVTYGDGGAAIVVPYSADATAADLAADWVMTHELVHLALPTLLRQHHWLEEGLATYVEPLARLRSGQLSAEQVFTDWVVGMPQGLPAAGDEGLDATPTWGRTYWGGALFYLQADVLLRQKSNGRLGLEDALRGVIAAGGNKSKFWDIEQVLQAGDSATGMSVLSTLYNQAKASPWGPDLPALWAQLGVHYDGKKVTFSDAAPLAFVRRGIISGGSVTNAEQEQEQEQALAPTPSSSKPHG